VAAAKRRLGASARPRCPPPAEQWRPGPRCTPHGGTSAGHVGTTGGAWVSRGRGGGGWNWAGPESSGRSVVGVVGCEGIRSLGTVTRDEGRGSLRELGEVALLEDEGARAG
jgi:hypothetical protein